MRWLGFLLFTAVLAGCDLQPVEEKTIAEIPSPGSGARAILRERDCGATCSLTYVVYLGSVQRGGEVLIVDHSDVPKLRWQNAKELVVSIPCGRIFKFSNFNGYDVFIRLENERLNCS